MKSSDLIYLATIILLSTRGGAINNQDIAKARDVATRVYTDFFGLKARMEREEQDVMNHVLAVS